MKKIIFLSMTCLLLTGCTVNYNLEIDDMYFKETITGNVLKSEMKNDENKTDVNLFDLLINNDQEALQDGSNTLYEKTITEKDNSIDYNYEFTYNENSISNSRILNSCFENFEFKNEENEYYLITYGEFYCKYSDEIKINIKTDNKVNIHNANKEKDNTYTWIINNENVDNFELNMVIDKNEKQDKNSNFAWSTLKTIVLILMLITSGIALFLLKKKEKQY